MSTFARFEDVLARAREGDAEALDSFPGVARELLGEGRALLDFRPVYRVLAEATKHGPRRVLWYNGSLAMLGDGVTRRSR